MYCMLKVRGRGCREYSPSSRSCLGLVGGPTCLTTNKEYSSSGTSKVKALGYWLEDLGFKPQHCQADIVGPLNPFCCRVLYHGWPCALILTSWDMRKLFHCAVMHASQIKAASSISMKSACPRCPAYWLSQLCCSTCFSFQFTIKNRVKWGENRNCYANRQRKYLHHTNKWKV